MNQSIRNRLLVTTTAVLAVFLTLTAWVLDRSFRDSLLTGAEEQLALVIYSVMGAVEERERALSIESNLAQPRLMQPESGLYVKVSDDLGAQIWMSPSAQTSNVEFPSTAGEPGDFVFTETIAGTVPRFLLSYTVIWEGVDAERVKFSALVDQQPFRESINQFRRSLGLGLGLVTIVFVLAQLLALRWGLSPLGVMAREVRALESGDLDRLGSEYPQELQGLAENLDRFVDHEQRSRTRYRNALDDLAHSLKTPLAVVRNALLEKAPDQELLSDQLDRMESTVKHQLSKASARGPVVVGKSVMVGDLVQRLVKAIQTAYVELNISVSLDIADEATIRGDERDFLEVFGNLVDNAFKYTQGAVHIRVINESQGATCIIDDDGPGIPELLRADVLDRGKRVDEIQNGQGIGLAMVAELVELYSGRLEIGASNLGGARITVWLA